MIREAFLNYFADAFFGIAVGKGDWSGVRLPLDFDLWAVMGKNFLGGFVAEFYREGFKHFVLFSTEFGHSNQIVLEELVRSFGMRQPQKFEKTHSRFDLGGSFLKHDAMFNTPIHVIDFEGSRRSGIVEYGVATLQEGRITETRTRLCAPIGVMQMREIQQHGIRQESLSDAKPFSEDWDYFAGLRASGPLCAHNAGYEDALLSEVWACPRQSPDFARPDSETGIADWGPWLDTLQLYRNLYPDLARHNLSELIEIFDLTQKLERLAVKFCPETRRCFHAALYDALASACLFLHLLEEPALKEVTLAWLLQQSAPSRSTREALSQIEFSDDAGC